MVVHLPWGSLTTHGRVKEVAPTRHHHGYILRTFLLQDKTRLPWQLILHCHLVTTVSIATVMSHHCIMILRTQSVMGWAVREQLSLNMISSADDTHTHRQEQEMFQLMGLVSRLHLIPHLNINTTFYWLIHFTINMVILYVYACMSCDPWQVIWSCCVKLIYFIMWYNNRCRKYRTCAWQDARHEV